MQYLLYLHAVSRFLSSENMYINSVFRKFSLDRTQRAEQLQIVARKINKNSRRNQLPELSVYAGSFPMRLLERLIQTGDKKKGHGTTKSKQTTLQFANTLDLISNIGVDSKKKKTLNIAADHSSQMATKYGDIIILGHSVRQVAIDHHT